MAYFGGESGEGSDLFDSVNHAPVAVVNDIRVSRGATATVPGSFLLSNDTDSDGDTLSVIAAGGATSGSSVSTSGGDVFFTATTSTSIFSTVFNYTISDGSLTANANVVVHLVATDSASNTVFASTGSNWLSWIDGQAGNDAITGADGLDTLIGGLGTDKLYGMANNDTLIGGADADTIDGGAGIDVMYGGSGNDTYTVDNIADIVDEGFGNGTADGGTDDGGVDTVSSSITYTLRAYFENLKLTGAASINGTGNDGNNTITGTTGVNILTGNGGKDILDGGVSDDTLLGGAGNDRLIGGTGTDTMDGGEDSDSYEGVTAVDIIHDTGTAGIDTVISSNNFTLATGNGIERLSTSAPTNVSLTGNELDNRITGGDGDNKLKGMAGADTILGGLGTDTIEGGIGRDVLSGEGDNDTFVFKSGDTTSTSATCDVIQDFLTGHDRIDLDIIGGSAGALTVAAYGENDVASDSFTTISNAAKAIMADGAHKVAFVSGNTTAYLFWNTDANLTTFEQVVRFTGLSDVNAFDRTDLF